MVAFLITPTLLSRDEDPDTPGTDEAGQSTGVGPPPTRDGDDRAVTPEGRRVLSDSTSHLLRQMLRLDVTQGTARKAEVPGYFVGGKTGTAEKIGANVAISNTKYLSFHVDFPDEQSALRRVCLCLMSRKASRKPIIFQQRAGMRRRQPGN